MGIGKRILSVLIGILFIISVSVLGGSLLAKQVLVKAISQAGIDTAISHRMMDAVFAKGIFPKDTPIENIPSDFWSYLISTWNEFLGALVENEMQF